MPTTKKFLKNRPACKVRFQIPAEHVRGIGRVHLVGEFNGWDANHMPMRQLRDGSFVAEVELPTGREYRYRYLLDGHSWSNDCAADSYEYCPFAGEDNSIVSV